MPVRTPDGRNTEHLLILFGKMGIFFSSYNSRTHNFDISKQTLLYTSIYIYILKKK